MSVVVLLTAVMTRAVVAVVVARSDVVIVMAVQ